jgi:hypothetical protein
MRKAPMALLLLLSLSGCFEESSDQKQARAQEDIKQQAVNSVGMPAIQNFAEMRMMRQILEKRDQNRGTYTYIVDMQGMYHLLCRSVGYGLPYATQFTNPQRITAGGHVIPQADPNGLFSPAAAEGTWVMCLNPDNQQSDVVYVEPRIVVMPWPMR